MADVSRNPRDEAAMQALNERLAGLEAELVAQRRLGEELLGETRAAKAEAVKTQRVAAREGVGRRRVAATPGGAATEAEAQAALTAEEAQVPAITAQTAAIRERLIAERQLTAEKQRQLTLFPRPIPGQLSLLSEEQIVAAPGGAGAGGGGGGRPPTLIPPAGGEPPRRPGAGGYGLIATGAEADAIALQRLGAVQALASQQMRRHGALTVEFLQALARGETTLAEFRFQIGATIGKFAGWTGAAAAVYGALGALRALGEGAIQTQSGTRGLERFLTNVNTDKAAQGFRDVARSVNEPIASVSEAQQAFARIFKTQNDSLLAARVALTATKLDAISTADSYRYFTGIVQGFKLTAAGLPGLLDQINAGQRDLGVRVSEILPGLARSSAAVRNASADSKDALSDLVAIIVTAQRATGTTGNIIGTALRRSATSFVTKKTNQDVIRSFGLDPEQATKAYTEFIVAATRKAATLSGQQRRELGVAIGGPQFGASVFAGLLRNADLLNEALGKTSPDQARGKTQEELRKKLQQVDEQLKKVGVTLGNLGSALAQSGAFVGLGLALKSLNLMLGTATQLVEVFDKLPAPVRQTASILAEVAIALKVLRGTGAGFALAQKTGIGFLGPTPQRAEAIAFRPALRQTISQQDTLAEQASLQAGVARSRKIEGAAIAAQSRLAATQAEAEVVTLQARGAALTQIAAQETRATELQAHAVAQEERQAALAQEEADQLTILAAAREQSVLAQARLNAINRGATLAETGFLIPQARGVGALVPPTSPLARGITQNYGATGGELEAAALASGFTRGTAEVQAEAAKMADFRTKMARQGSLLTRAGRSAGDAISGVGTVLGGAVRGLGTFLLNPLTAAIADLLIIPAEINSYQQEAAKDLATTQREAKRITDDASYRAKVDAFKAHSKPSTSTFEDVYSGFLDAATSVATPVGAGLHVLGIDVKTPRDKAAADAKRNKKDLEAAQTRYYAAYEELARGGVPTGATGGQIQNYFKGQVQNLKARRITNTKLADVYQQVLAAFAVSAEALAGHPATVRAEEAAATAKLAELARKPGARQTPYDYVSSLYPSKLDVPGFTTQFGGDVSRLTQAQTQHRDQRASIDAATAGFVFAAGQYGRADDPKKIQALADAQDQYVQAITGPAQKELDTALALAHTPGQKAAAYQTTIGEYKRAIAEVPRTKQRLTQQLKDARAALRTVQTQLDAAVVSPNARPDVKAEQLARRSNLKALRDQDLQIVQNIKKLLGPDFAKFIKGLLNGLLAALGGVRTSAAQDAAQATADARSLLESSNALATSGIQATGKGGDAARTRSDITGARRLLAFDRSHGAKQDQLNQDLTQINDLNRQLAEGAQGAADDALQKARDLAQARGAYAESKTSDPLKQKRIELDTAKKLVQYAKTPADRLNALAEVNNKRRDYVNARAQDALDTINYEADIGKLERNVEVQKLQALLKRHNLTRDLRRSITRQIYQLQHDDSANFADLDVGNIKLPTLYDVRRLIAQGTASAPGQVRVTNNVSMNVTKGADVHEIFDAAEARTGSSLRSQARAAGLY